MKQKILILESGLDDARKVAAKTMTEYLSDWIARTTQGEFTIEFTIRETDRIFHAVSGVGLSGFSYAAANVAYIDPSTVTDEGRKTEQELHTDFDIVGLLYAPEKLAEHPAVPIVPTHFPILFDGFTIFEALAIKGGDQSVINDFTMHEILHAWYYLARLSGSPLPDDVHAHSSTTDTNPKGNYSDIVEKLKPWWPALAKAGAMPEAAKPAAPIAPKTDSPDAIWKGSPNFWPDRKSYKPEAIVLHIMEGTLTGTDAYFSDAKSQVSTHYGIGKDGTLHQYVLESMAAWGNGTIGNPTWPLLKPGVNPNLYTISIEHEGTSTDTWTDELKTKSAKLVREIAARWNIPLDRKHVVGHYEIDSIRKPVCPAVDSNKKIVDEILALAIGAPAQPPEQPTAYADIVKELTDILAKLKALVDALSKTKVV